MRGARARLRAGAVIGLGVTLLVSACGGDGGEPSSQASGGTKVWFTAGEQFEPVDADSPDAGPKAALRELLDGPGSKELAEGDVPIESSIPEGVSLEQLDVEEAGTAVVKLSPEFADDIPDDPGQRTDEQDADLDARVGQVAYTLTQFEGIRNAKVLSGRKVVEPRVDRRDLAAPRQGPQRVPRARGPKLPGTRQVQKQLAKFGYLPKDAVDGLAGYRTEQAVMAFQAWEGLDRDGDVGPMTAAALEGARRPKPRKGGPAKRIEVYRDKGVALLVDGGRTKRAIHVSTGAPGTETPSGSYEVFRKELQSWSVPFQTWLPYASYFNNGIAFHEYPDVPPFPASHGCVRLPAPEAKGVYRFAALGTAVVVL
jgi:lipoprotein-anchoring transpeptidase ErfK/SrfK